MNLDLGGKCALVTGGSHGIGRDIALTLAEEGCNVAICARNSPKPGYQGKLEQTLTEIKANGVDGIGIIADVLIPAHVQRVQRAVIEAWGTIQILVNNVGGGGTWGNSDVERTEEQVWFDVYNKNAFAATRFTMWAIPYMRKQKWGRIVTISSIFGREGGSRPWYGMAKAAEVALMKNLALDHRLARDGITFNAIAPGSIMIPDTGWEHQREADPEAFKEMIDQDFPLGRLGTPKEIASVVAFVCSERASLINGAAIPVDGGESRIF